MVSSKTAIIDFGVGNLHNILRAVRLYTDDVEICSTPEAINAADALVLPGVGAFQPAIANLDNAGLIEPIKLAAAANKPILGICLGMQLLMTESEENGLCKGLDIVAGEVRHMQPPGTAGANYKVPHIGWNSVIHRGGKREAGADDALWHGTVLSELDDEPVVYFLHSYVVVPERDEDNIAVTNYGRDRFCSVMQHGNVFGCQFHPERSGHVGLQIIKNFITKTAATQTQAGENAEQT
jgi:imidazole glycerol-phosphate synthase subunit HisH